MIEMFGQTNRRSSFSFTAAYWVPLRLSIYQVSSASPTITLPALQPPVVDKISVRSSIASLAVAASLSRIVGISASSMPDSVLNGSTDTILSLLSRVSVAETLRPFSFVPAA